MFFRLPLYIRVILGVIFGAILGFTFQQREILWGWTNADSGQVAGLYVQLLTALATPLVFFAIVDAFVRTSITRRQGGKMFVICVMNIIAAFAVGLTILNVWQPGKAWSSQFQQVEAAETPGGIPVEGPEAKDGLEVPSLEAGKDLSLSPLDLVRSHIPKSILQPFTENMVLAVAMLAICIGGAMRALKHAGDAEVQQSMAALDQVIVACFQIVLKLLLWLIEFAPIAICLAVSGVIGSTGWGVLQMAGVFLLSMCCGLAVHSLIYYPLSIWLFAGISPVQLFQKAGGAILTGFSLNSSLATSPLTLQALKHLGVSDSSSRLSACVGTNFNNDGVTLYEAMTALFVAQAMGMDMSIGQQITILLAALVGSMGIAGIPNSGLMILALVLKAAKLPESAIQIAIPLIYSIDFLIARIRSAVNVMGDLQVAILLDVGVKPNEADSVIEANADA
ncbi:dicarboxylate/amino acid:cation symporter [Planctomicrobium sp. SH664]|uniref:dicarboxylate/amino acid:cation symporter n=1 Tax=Planctomicrobium sp. SH664 TaxID=3448125 RepID=UPI003F5C43DA